MMIHTMEFCMRQRLDCFCFQRECFWVQHHTAHAQSLCKYIASRGMARQYFINHALEMKIKQHSCKLPTLCHRRRMELQYD